MKLGNNIVITLLKKVASMDYEYLLNIIRDFWGYYLSAVGIIFILVLIMIAIEIIGNIRINRRSKQRS